MFTYNMNGQLTNKLFLENFYQKTHKFFMIVYLFMQNTIFIESIPNTVVHCTLYFFRVFTILYFTPALFVFTIAIADRLASSIWPLSFPFGHYRSGKST